MNVRTLGLLAEICECCDDVEDKLQHFRLDHRTWVFDRFSRDSVLLSLSRIGELVSHFRDDEYLAVFPDVPWREIKAMRNFIVHDYKNVDLEQAWYAATQDVPALRSSLLESDEVRGRYEYDAPVVDDDIEECLGDLARRHR